MRKLALTLVPLLLAACSDQPSSTALDEAVPAPSFDFSNGPAEPGNSYIVRGEYGDFFWMVIDPNTELAAWFTDDDFDCADFEAATPVPTQTIFNPSGDNLQMYHEGGWVNTLVLKPPYGCDDVLAVGQVHNLYFDNDVYAWVEPGHPRSNPAGFNMIGRVGAYNVKWHWHLTWGGVNKPDHVFFVNETVTVR
jgi:hypothetical protein